MPWNYKSVCFRRVCYFTQFLIPENSILLSRLRNHHTCTRNDIILADNVLSGHRDLGEENSVLLHIWVIEYTSDSDKATAAAPLVFLHQFFSATCTVVRKLRPRSLKIRRNLIEDPSFGNCSRAFRPRSKTTARALDRTRTVIWEIRYSDKKKFERNLTQLLLCTVRLMLRNYLANLVNAKSRITVTAYCCIPADACLKR